MNFSMVTSERAWNCKRVSDGRHPWRTLGQSHPNDWDALQHLFARIFRSLIPRCVASTAQIDGTSSPGHQVVGTDIVTKR